jgi:hypothetical protein
LSCEVDALLPTGKRGPDPTHWKNNYKKRGLLELSLEVKKRDPEPVHVSACDGFTIIWVSDIFGALAALPRDLLSLSSDLLTF